MIRFILTKLLEALLFITGLFIFPFAYILRKSKLKIFWPWLNSDEVDDISNMYGDENWRNSKGFQSAGSLKKFWIAYRWNAFRNFAWNIRQVIGRDIVGDKKNVRIIINEGDGTGLTWMNKSLFGRKYAKFDVNGKKLFRYSFTRPLRKWSPWRLFYKNINFMAGAGDTRQILKLRIFK